MRILSEFPFAIITRFAQFVDNFAREPIDDVDTCLAQNRDLVLTASAVETV